MSTKKLTFTILFLALLFGAGNALNQFYKTRNEKRETEEKLKQADKKFGEIKTSTQSYFIKEDPSLTISAKNVTPPVNDQTQLAKVYKYNLTKKLTEQDGIRVAKALGLLDVFETQADKSLMFTNASKMSALTFSPESGQFNYYSREINYSSTLPTLESVKGTALALLDQFNLPDFKFIPNESEVKYLIKKDKEYSVDGTIANYDTILLPFVRDVPQFKTTSFPYQNALVVFAFGPGNKVSAMSIFYAPLTNESSTYILKTYEQALNDLEEKKGTLVNLDLPKDYYTQIDRKEPAVLSFNATSVEILYLDRQNVEYLSPVYVVSGNAYTTDNKYYGATYYVDALE